MESHADGRPASASHEYARPRLKVYGSAAEVTLTAATNNNMNDPGNSSQTKT
jgi:hypothetical protein